MLEVCTVPPTSTKQSERKWEQVKNKEKVQRSPPHPGHQRITRWLPSKFMKLKMLVLIALEGPGTNFPEPKLAFCIILKTS